jgi:hypothetical protein
MDERQEVFLTRARHLRQEIEQILVDAEHWNRTHPDEEPIDPDPEGELLLERDWLNLFIARYEGRNEHGV